MNFVTLTLTPSATIVGPTCFQRQYNLMADKQFQMLEQKIDELIGLCSELNHENRLLKADSEGWQRERQDLMDKNELARTRVEAMIKRLRTMEREA